MKALDLFCGAGGASVGLKQAGFDEITGIDIEPQSEYPFEFRCGDVMNLPIHYLKEFDFIWASPPCQAHTLAARRWKRDYIDLVPATRKLLERSHRPYVIENIYWCRIGKSPVRRDLVLTGDMFGLKVIRRRAFELSGFWVMAPMPQVTRGLVKAGAYITAAGHGGDGSGKLSRWQEAMGIDWISDKKVLAQAVPPAYAKYIGEAFLAGRKSCREPT